MKYTKSININLPLKRVIELFDNPDNMKDWMEGLQKFEHLSGVPGEPGAQSKLYFKMGKREFDMTETIITSNFPHEFSGTYDMKGTKNHINNYFKEESDGTTSWTATNEFIFESWMMKALGFLAPGIFKKQSMKFMVAFKEFAEGRANSD